jgi:hypothetical protein
MRDKWQLLADFVAEVGCGERQSVIHRPRSDATRGLAMMGRLNRDQGQLFYSFCLDDVVPSDHRVREIAAVLDLSWVHSELAPYLGSSATADAQRRLSRAARATMPPVLLPRLRGD